MNFIGENNIYQEIGSFVLSLTNVSYRPKIKKIDIVGISSDKCNSIEFVANQNANYTYSIITLNYDRLIESIFSYIDGHESLEEGSENLFLRDNNGLKLYKFHGSIDREIIPPTWNKILNDHVRQAWQGAYQVLKKAKHIRILGYSMPNTDSYIKFC